MSNATTIRTAFTFASLPTAGTHSASIRTAAASITAGTHSVSVRTPAPAAPARGV